MFRCPMHPDVRQEGPGTCPTCGMNLVQDGQELMKPKRKLSDFLPLIVMLAVVAGLTKVALWRTGVTGWFDAMRYFEGFFFLVFGSFKVLNLNGFVDAFSTYDIIAKRSRIYGYLYPFTELALAIGYIFSYKLELVAWITLVLMVVSSIGVLGALRRKDQIPCACLGVVFKIPMTWVTFFEDVVMAVMAVMMIRAL